MNTQEKQLDLASIYKACEHTSPYKHIGKILSSKGLLYEAGLPRAALGSHVEFQTEHGEQCLGEVVSLKGDRCYVMPYQEISGINSGTRVVLKGAATKIKVTEGLLGRVIDFQCNPIDKKGDIDYDNYCLKSIFGESINPLERPQINEALDVGIHSINCFTTMGKGQRMAVMAGPGVGKSSILGMIARHTNADVNVIALIGERGREVLEFIENDLNENAMKKTVVVVATSEMSPLIRTKAAYVATTIAEYFRDEGNDVLLMMDSITRFAMANREMGLSLGESPGPKGYTPSVFSKLAKLLERSGRTMKGSITGIYAVLVEGHDMDEPIADAIRAIADGHIVLSRELALRNHFPAVDILQSISRVMDKVVSLDHLVLASHFRELLASYRDNEDMINIGAYVKGSNGLVDKALMVYDDLMNLMKQLHGTKEHYNIKELVDLLVGLAQRKEKASPSGKSEGDRAA